MTVAGAPLLAELDRDAARRLAPECVLVFPVGSTEQHGPHLPAGTDALHVEHVARAAADLAAEQVPVVVAPTLPYGSSEHHLAFGATLSLDTETLYRVLVSLGRSAVASGFRRLFFVNGHAGNHDVIRVAARDLSLQEHVHTASGSWWQIASDALAAAGAAALGGVPGHAGAFETAIVRAIAPDLVAEGTVPPGKPVTATGPGGPQRAWRTDLDGAWLAIDGWTDDPRTGAAETGRSLLAAAVTAVADAFVTFHGDGSPLPSPHPDGGP